MMLLLLAGAEPPSAMLVKTNAMPSTVRRSFPDRIG